MSRLGKANREVMTDVIERLSLFLDQFAKTDQIEKLENNFVKPP